MIIDKSIPYKNILMKCDEYLPKKITLPDGYHFRRYRPGDEEEWARLEMEICDFDTYENAVKYFKNKYLSNIDELKKRFICVESDNGECVGIVIAWFDNNNGEPISTVHWLVTSPKAQGKGIGYALILKLLETFHNLDAFPVYLHTQPWSYSAIGIYIKSGFKILKSETIMGYENQYGDAIEILRELLSPDKYDKLINDTI